MFYKYTQFRYEEDAEKAVIDLNNRWFNGQPIHAELSPVTDFREACCRQYEMGWVLQDRIVILHRCDSPEATTRYHHDNDDYTIP